MKVRFSEMVIGGFLLLSLCGSGNNRLCYANIPVGAVDTTDEINTEKQLCLIILLIYSKKLCISN